MTVSLPFLVQYRVAAVSVYINRVRRAAMDVSDKYVHSVMVGGAVIRLPETLPTSEQSCADWVWRH